VRRVDGIGVDQHGEVDGQGGRRVDPLLADHGAGIGGRRVIDDRDDRHGLRRGRDALEVGQRAGDRRGRRGDRCGDEAREQGGADEHGGQANGDGATEWHGGPRIGR
jgi:hypothetical protein